MLEYGTPLHAFDYDKLNGYLCVRRAQEGETLVTLDEVERKLTNDTVLIASKEHPVCLGGVFGGANSEIDDNTKNLALEAAYFTASANRKAQEVLVINPMLVQDLNAVLILKLLNRHYLELLSFLKNMRRQSLLVQLKQVLIN